MTGSSWTSKKTQIGVTTVALLAIPLVVILILRLIADSRVSEQLSLFWENVDSMVNLLTLLWWIILALSYVWKSYTTDEGTEQLLLGQDRLLEGQNEIAKALEKLRSDVVGDSEPEPRNVIVNLRNKGYPRISEILEAAIDNFEEGKAWECIARLRLAVEATYSHALRILGLSVSEVPHFGTMRKAEHMLVNRGNLTPVFLNYSSRFTMVTSFAIHSTEEPDIGITSDLIDVATTLIEELLDAVEEVTRVGNMPSR